MVRLKASYTEPNELLEVVEQLKPFYPKVSKQYTGKNPKTPYRAYIDLKITYNNSEKADK